MNELARDQLPLRKRGTLEIFDVSLKLFKRYFVPIIVWSLISGLVGLAGMVIPGAGLVSFVVTPFLLGAVGCCLAAAVHGRDVTIGDCWNFSKKRYGSILLVYFLSSLLAIIFALALIFVFVLLGLGGAYVFSRQLISSTAGSISIAVLIIVAGLFTSVFFACLFAWMGMVPLALCLEGDGKDNVRFLRRTYNLMSGHWWRIFGLVSLVGIAILGLAVILMGMASVIIGIGTLKEITSGHISPESVTKIIAGYVGSFSIISILWAPFYYLALGVQYLDLRVRKEALDLEWAAQEKPSELA
ncbi:MAG: hypothetical protein ABI210_06470 [Abditibacteriaceae bacterium]